MSIKKTIYNFCKALVLFKFKDMLQYLVGLIKITILYHRNFEMYGGVLLSKFEVKMK